MANQVNIPVLILFESRGTKGTLRVHLSWNKKHEILPRKARTTFQKESPVPQTDTGGLVEDTKGRERTLSKELGKMAP
jgi:hypothetical protein